jgi:hypothetical protein
MAPNALPQSIIHRRGIEQPSDKGRGILRAECDHFLITDRLLGSFLGAGDQEIRQGTSLKSGGPLKQLFLYRADASHEPMGFRWAVGLERLSASEFIPEKCVSQAYMSSGRTVRGRLAG